VQHTRALPTHHAQHNTHTHTRTRQDVTSYIQCRGRARKAGSRYCFMHDSASPSNIHNIITCVAALAALVALVGCAQLLRGVCVCVWGRGGGAGSALTAGQEGVGVCHHHHLVGVHTA
jgi:hypothetical protein